MKKKLPFIKIYLVIMLIIISSYIFFTYSCMTKFSDNKPDIIKVNDVSKSIEENWDKIFSTHQVQNNKSASYAIILSTGQLICKTNTSNYLSLNESIVNRDTIVDINVNNNITGKVIIENDSSDRINSLQSTLLTYAIIFVISLSILAVVFILVIYLNIIKPFYLLKNFASTVASGNLDIPLNMDRNNIFGAFTESFDIMREELMLSKERERELEQSKKELVASLSHDIKTPVASIKAVSELMQVQNKNEKADKQINIIMTKADQIEHLINNLFHSTLEEMNELKVNNSDEDSSIIYDMIKTSDYNRQVQPFTIPECIISCDRLRLQQVFDNIINNSYKYAETDIKIDTEICDKYLVISVTDFGKSCNEEELSLLCEKFYRGSNTTKITGSGLGLYISDYFMTKMNGSLDLSITSDGFCVQLMISMP